MDWYEIFSMIGIVITILSFYFAIKLYNNTKKIDYNLKKIEVSKLFYEKRLLKYNEMSNVLKGEKGENHIYDIEEIVEKLIKSIEIYEAECKILFSNDILKSYMEAVIFMSMNYLTKSEIEESKRYNLLHGTAYESYVHFDVNDDIVNEKIQKFDTEIIKFIKNEMFIENK